MEAQGKTNQKFKTMITQIVEDQKEIKNHISKLTSALAVEERGKFSAQPQPNPKGQYMAQTSGSNINNLREVNAITTRSGKVIEQPLDLWKLRKSLVSLKIVALGRK